MKFLVVIWATTLCLSAQVKSDPEQDLIRARRAAVISAKKAEKDAKEALKKADTPAMKVARQELTAEQKTIARQEKTAREVVSSAQMVGCKSIATITEVALNPRLAGPATVIVSPYGTRTSRVNVMTSVRILNIGTFPIDIESPLTRYGVLVRNLCSGGAITLSFTLNWEDQNQLTIPLLAIARTPDGRVATEEMSLTLDRYRQENQRVDARTWRVHLQPEHQIR